MNGAGEPELADSGSRLRTVRLDDVQARREGDTTDEQAALPGCMPLTGRRTRMTMNWLEGMHPQMGASPQLRGAGLGPGGRPDGQADSDAGFAE